MKTEKNLRRIKNYVTPLFFIVLLMMLSSCALQAKKRRPHKKSLTVEEYIQKKVSEGLDQYKYTEINEEPPQAKLGFDGDIILKVPRTLRVYGKPIERKYRLSNGSFSEILPGGWRLLLENNQKGWIVHSLGQQEYPLLDETAILPERRGK